MIKENLHNVVTCTKRSRQFSGGSAGSQLDVQREISNRKPKTKNRSAQLSSRETVDSAVPVDTASYLMLVK